MMSLSCAEAYPRIAEFLSKPRTREDLGSREYGEAILGRKLTDEEYAAFRNYASYGRIMNEVARDSQPQPGESDDAWLKRIENLAHSQMTTTERGSPQAWVAIYGECTE